MTTINVAGVDTPTHTYTKAKAILSDDHLTVTDRRGRVLLEVDARRRVDGSVFVYGEVRVSAMGGCECGGTRVDEKPSDLPT